MPRRPPPWAVLAFAVGAVVHLGLLGLAFGPSGYAALAAGLMLLAALPAAIVDVSAEVLHPSGIGTVAIVALATTVNGAFYVGIAALVRWLDARRSR